MRLNRRKFLVGTGGVTLALPFLSKLAGRAYADAGAPRRLIVLAYPMGTITEHWKPSALGSTFELPYITQPLDPFKERCLFVSDIDLGVMQLNAQVAFGHPAKQEGALTGTLLTGAFQSLGPGSNRIDNIYSDQAGSDEGGANGESVDNFIARRLTDGTHDRASIDLAVTGDDHIEDTQTSSFFFEGPANPVTLFNNPAVAFNTYFAGIEPGDTGMEALRQLRERNQSVLDGVRAEFVELRSGLDAADRTILDDHAARIRQIEIDIDRAACTPPTGIPTGGFDGMSMNEQSTLMKDILVNAMRCGLAPVGRLQFTNQQGPNFGIPSVDIELARWNAAMMDWHGMVHGDAGPDGVRSRPDRDTGVGDYNQALLDGYRFFVQQMADVMSELDRIPEGVGTMLDNTLVVLASDFGDGHGHSANKMCWVMGGNTGPARSGYYMSCLPSSLPHGPFYSDSTYKTNHLLTSIINMFCLTNDDGTPIEEFGLAGYVSGTLPIFT